MELQIIEGGAPVGTLSVSVRGLYTLFEAELRGEGRGVSRLWLVGRQGEAASLGLPEPRGGKRILRRRLTRLELRQLPPEPWTALVLPAEERPFPEEVRRASPAAARGRPEAPALPEKSAARSRRPEPTASPPQTDRPGDGPAVRGPQSASVWLRLADGSLIDPERRLLALPWGGGALPAAARKITLDGRDYLVFRT